MFLAFVSLRLYVSTEKLLLLKLFKLLLLKKIESIKRRLKSGTVLEILLRASFISVPYMVPIILKHQLLA